MRNNFKAGEPSGAQFSDDKEHRHFLWRIWDRSLPMVMCVGLNPSTANADTNDRTIGKLCGPKGLLAKNGFGALIMTNLFTFITPYPEELNTNLTTDHNMLSTLRTHCAEIVFCWGAFPATVYASEGVEKLFPDALCFGKNKGGSPKHPLYLSGSTKLIKFHE